MQITNRFKIKRPPYGRAANLTKVFDIILFSQPSWESLLKVVTNNLKGYWKVLKGDFNCAGYPWIVEYMLIGC